MTNPDPAIPINAVSTMLPLSLRYANTDEKTTIQNDQVVAKIAASANGALSMAM
ncbi:hypothetical protein DSLASN_09940 [Desulfoluna limicola]|uniref:Uncharacterized protein n=1 Tax=Desulfoluna limicola TaxID=2810562 RepID=A0ABN6F239_9BACT|nr:hypothetical protein DSLASN_09940 [Desulfoluna limicola]